MIERFNRAGVKLDVVDAVWRTKTHEEGGIQAYRWRTGRSSTLPPGG
jgi:hypothetical protein